MSVVNSTKQGLTCSARGESKDGDAHIRISSYATSAAKVKVTLKNSLDTHVLLDVHLDVHLQGHRHLAVRTHLKRVVHNVCKFPLSSSSLSTRHDYTLFSPLLLPPPLSLFSLLLFIAFLRYTPLSPPPTSPHPRTHEHPARRVTKCGDRSG